MLDRLRAAVRHKKEIAQVILSRRLSASRRETTSINAPPDAWPWLEELSRCRRHRASVSSIYD